MADLAGPPPQAAQVALFPDTTTASGIVAALRNWHERDQRDWAFFTELQISTGFSPRRIDAWALCLWPSSGMRSIGYEVKVSRSDFLHELKQPQKRRLAMVISQEFYFVTPVGLVKIDEIPVGCGLIEVPTDGGLRTRLAAPHFDPPPPSWRFVGVIARLAMRTLKQEEAT